MNTPIPAKSSRPNQIKPTSIPVLVRNRCVHSGNKSTLPIIQSVPLVDLAKYSGEDEYIVDDAPIEECNGMVLQLKLPILKPKKQTHTSFPFEVSNNGPIPERETTQEVRSENMGVAFEDVPVASSPINQTIRELIHIGYTPIAEEEAFGNTNMPNIHIPSLPCTHFTIPRGDMSIDIIINLIREVVGFNENLHAVIPSNMIYKESLKIKIYESTLIYTYFDETGYRAVKLQVALQVSPNPDNIFVIVERLRGDTRPFLAIYNTLRDYIKSEGTSNCRVSPKMSSYSSTIGFDEIGFANTNISVFGL